MSNDRLRNEVDFHNKRYKNINERSETSLFYCALSNIYDDYIKVIKKNDDFNKSFLEIGVGKASYASFVSKAIYHGIDCSDIAVNYCNKKFLNHKNINFYVKDAHKTNFPNNHFDLIFGMGILHHLDFNKAIHEIKRISRSSNILFVEPLQSNYFVRLYRLLSPDSRSPDEKPLNLYQIDYIIKNFKGVKVYYYGLTSLLLIVLRVKMFRSFFFSLDNYLSRFKFLRKLYWAVLITRS